MCSPRQHSEANCQSAQRVAATALPPHACPAALPLPGPPPWSGLLPQATSFPSTAMLCCGAASRCSHDAANLPLFFLLALQGRGPQPEVIHETATVRLWHRLDPSFRVPKAVLYVHMQLAGEVIGVAGWGLPCSGLDCVSWQAGRGACTPALRTSAESFWWC